MKEERYDGKCHEIGKRLKKKKNKKRKTWAQQKEKGTHIEEMEKWKLNWIKGKTKHK